MKKIIWTCEYPIVTWAKRHGMRTADMTVSDMQKFMRWWMKEKYIVEDRYEKRGGGSQKKASSRR